MYLKSIDIFGFKSFPEKTSIEFGQGITVIVGPNGCGKSNIVDSIKWVLGEKQAKNIRGAKMEDVIFTGTESRKPLSLAEVSLTMDNREHILNFESDTVTVTRRVFRDGESEYLINKSPVRLKDIDSLFLDTGIGKTAYSVMEQGKIDMILSSSAEDRRYIFEEAAGISKYKMQKKESLRKLQDTGANLERINDIIKEIEREKELKAKQSEKTKFYLTLKGELTDNDIQYNFLRYREMVKRKEKLQEDLERLRKQREELSAKMSLISSENEKDEKEKNDIQLQLFELDKELHTFRIRIEDIDQKAEKNRARISEQKNRKAAVQKNIEERTENLNRLSEEKKKAEQNVVEIGNRIVEDREKLKTFRDTKTRKIESIKNAGIKIEENKVSIKEAEKQLITLREELEQVIKRLVEEIDSHKAEWLKSEHERQDVQKLIYDKLDDLSGRISGALESLRNGGPSDAAAALEALDMGSLRELIEKFESYGDGFRSLLFDKGGVHSEKENIDRQIREKVTEVDDLRIQVAALEEHIKSEQKELDDVNAMISRIEKDLSRNETERDWITKHIDYLASQIRDIEKQIKNYGEDIGRCDEVIAGCEKEIRDWENSLIEFSEKSQSLNTNIVSLTEKRTSIDSKIQERKNVSKKETDSLNRIVERTGEVDKALIEQNFRLERIEEYLWTEYEKKVADVPEFEAEALQQGDLQRKIQELKKRIQDLGPINNLAIEEFRDLKKRFEYYINQK
nr:AAA family ATPase [Spirochaetota bacterium]